MFKQMLALVFVMLGGGTWFYLDCLTKQEKGNAELVHQGIIQAREEVKKRATIKLAFEKQLVASLTNCNATADKAKTDFMALFEHTAPRKRGLAVIPQTVFDESEKILTAAKAECQKEYDGRMKNGI